MAHSIANHNALHPVHTETRADDQATLHVERDPGPWLAMTGPLMLALTILAVSWLSTISF